MTVSSILVTNRSFFLRLMREMGVARQASTTHPAITNPCTWLSLIIGTKPTGKWKQGCHRQEKPE